MVVVDHDSLTMADRRRSRHRGDRRHGTTVVEHDRGEHVTTNEHSTDNAGRYREADVEAPPGTANIIVRRSFSAEPPEVFKAFTVEELFAQWTAATPEAIEIVRFDARTGGEWQYRLHVVPGQPPFGFRGVFHEVRRDQRIVQTFEFDRAPGTVTLSTTLFEAAAGGTLVTTISAMPSEQHRDQVLDAGMRTGADEGYRRLESMLADNRTSGSPAAPLTGRDADRM